jgi:DNA-binding SARP family transcriptional activator/class 3 adenylate cyclase/tetratricopeptide (TPR) repeat protein
MAEVASRTVTFLFTDIEGSTRLLTRLRGRYADVLDEHRRLLRTAFAAHDGREIGTEGDAFFVAFARASDAIVAAVKAQRALACQRWPESADVRVRMGIHTGEAEVRMGQYVGLDVHRAARICAVGHGGQVLLSSPTRELIADELPADVALRDLGEHRLKDLDHPEHLFQLVAADLPADFPPLTSLSAGRADGTMQFRILGPLDVRDGDRPVAPPRTKHRILLAMLLLHANEAVSTEQLIEALWEDEHPPTAHKTLQIYVSQLRKALGRDRLRTQPPGYLLRVEEDELDLARFERLVREGRHKEALALWRGPPLAEFAYERFAQGEIGRLEELRLTCLEGRIQGELEAGRHAELVGELTAIVADHPLRERFRAQLMLALYRSGRQAEALAAYRVGRQALVDELGIEPERSLRDLEQAILEQDPSLDLASSAQRAPEPAPETTGAFVGREPELGRLLAGLEDAVAGRGRLFLISGEPGIGKTRIADEVVRRAEARGVRVLAGRCWEGGGAPAYWPWAQALRGYVRGAAPEALRAQLGTGAVDLAQMLPQLREALPGLPEPVPLDADGARFRLLDATAEFLRNMSAAQPTVLVLDDVHAADPPSLALLRFLARELGSMHLLVLAAYRDVDPVPGQPLTEMLVEATREPATQRLALAGLSDLQVLEYMTRMAPDIASPKLAATVHEQSEGNPLFVGEAARLLALEGVAAEDGDEPRLAIPETVREVIGRRLTHLSGDCNRLLLLASVFGREFPVDAIARLDGVVVDELLDRLDEAVAARVLSDVPGSPGRLRFAHVLIRDALYDGLPAARRVRLHARVAQTLEDMYRGAPDGVAETPARIIAVAQHWSAAGDAARAIACYRRGAELALRVFASYDAADALTRAIDLLHGRPESPARDEEELDLTMMLAVARGWGSMVYSRARDLCVKLGRPVIPPILRGMVLDALLRLDLATARDLAVALVAVAERDGDAVILVEGEYAMGVTSFWAGRFREARDHLQQAIDRYAPERHETHVRLYSQDPKVVCLSRLAWTWWFLGRRDEAAGARDAAVSLGDALGHPMSRCYAYVYGAIVSQELGDEASRAWLVATAETIATDARLEVLRGWSALLAHAAAALRGDRKALAATDAAIRGFEERGQMLLMAYFRSLLGRAHLVAGQPERGLDAVAGALTDTERTGFRYLESELHRVRGELLAASGAEAADIDAAFDLADDVARRQEAEALAGRAADARRRWRSSIATPG